MHSVALWFHCDLLCAPVQVFCTSGKILVRRPKIMNHRVSELLWTILYSHQNIPVILWNCVCRLMKIISMVQFKFQHVELDFMNSLIHIKNNSTTTGINKKTWKKLSFNIAQYHTIESKHNLQKIFRERNALMMQSNQKRTKSYRGGSVCVCAMETQDNSIRRTGNPRHFT